MTNDNTIPTIAELKGNTILELLSNVYTTLKNAIFRKQNKLIAGDNIIIDENTNRISAIVGGEPTLEDYYTKEETDELLDGYYDKTEVDEFLTGIEGDLRDVNTELENKADAEDVYTKAETDALLDEKADGDNFYTKAETISLVNIAGYTKINTVVPRVDGVNIAIEDLQDGDIIDITYQTNQRTLASADIVACIIHSTFVFTTSMDRIVGGTTNFTDANGILSGTIAGCSCYATAKDMGTYLRIQTTGTKITMSNGNFVGAYTHTDTQTIKGYTILRKVVVE